jgi:hypothetical protein
MLAITLVKVPNRPNALMIPIKMFEELGTMNEDSHYYASPNKILACYELVLGKERNVRGL